MLDYQKVLFFFHFESWGIPISFGAVKMGTMGIDEKDITWYRFLQHLTGSTGFRKSSVVWIWPPHSNSDHEDFYIFS